MKERFSYIPIPPPSDSEDIKMLTTILTSLHSLREARAADVAATKSWEQAASKAKKISKLSGKAAKGLKILIGRIPQLAPLSVLVTLFEAFTKLKYASTPAKVISSLSYVKGQLKRIGDFEIINSELDALQNSVKAKLSVDDELAMEEKLASVVSKWRSASVPNHVQLLASLSIQMEHIAGGVFGQNLQGGALKMLANKFIGSGDTITTDVARDLQGLVDHRTFTLIKDLQHADELLDAEKLAINSTILITMMADDLHKLRGLNQSGISPFASLYSIWEDGLNSIKSPSGFHPPSTKQLHSTVQT
jgi:hypothetical protein